MNNKKWLAITIIIINLTFLPLISISLSSTTNLYVEPTSTVALIGENFSINISIAEVTDLCGWEIKLYFKNDILNATDCEEGPFLQSHGSTEFHSQITNNYNETHGLIRTLCTLNDFTSGGVDGSGTLASITFKATNGGNSPLTLKDTKLRNRNVEPINHTTNDGNVQVTGTADIAITNVTPSKTIIGQSYTMKINVTVENQGDTTETWNVTTYTNTTLIETKETTLANGTSTTMTFTWNTSGFAKGNYTISAYAWPVPGETDTTDNTFVDGCVKVAIPGDVNGDGTVDIFDAVIIALSFGSCPDDSNWDPRADIIEDYLIDIFDLVVVALHFGEIEA